MAIPQERQYGPGRLRACISSTMPTCWRKLTSTAGAEPQSRHSPGPGPRGSPGGDGGGGGADTG